MKSRRASSGRSARAKGGTRGRQTPERTRLPAQRVVQLAAGAGIVLAIFGYLIVTSYLGR
jgi:hypothetical protein